MMKKYFWTLIVGLLSVGQVSAVDKNAPNVLFIMVDDLRPELGAYGKTVIKSPNIDKLANEGVMFTNAYVNVPVCGASRASMMTGLRPNKKRFRTFYARADEDAENAKTLFGYLTEQGYHTQSMGKIMHDAGDSVSQWSIAPWKSSSIGGMGHRNYVLEENIARFGRVKKGPPFESADVEDNAYFDGMIADHAIEALSDAKSLDQPFFMAVGFVKPHLPFNAPKRYWDLYNERDIELADNPFQPTNAPVRAVHGWGELRKFDGIPKKPKLVSDDMARKLIHGYYASVSYVDAQVGKVLGELDALGLSDNTIVFLLGDHGWSLGEHGLWAKHSPFDHATKTPLIVRLPSQKENPAATGAAHGLVEFVDIFPTILELTKQPKLDQLQGSSFVAQIRDPKAPGKTAVFPRYQLAEVIKTEDYALTEWYGKQGKMLARMLYDHRVDPEETHNVAEEPEYSDVVENLHNQLVDMMESR
jgi:iduronate 2-sulfatase